MIIDNSLYCTLDQNVLPLWIQALRDKHFDNGNRFCQVRGDLMRKKSCTINGYCCLGVLTQLYINLGLDLDGSVQYHLSHQATIPIQVAEWAGFDRYYSVSCGYDEYFTLEPADFSLESKLADMNDNEKRNFKTIADVLEKNFLQSELSQFEAIKL